LLEVQPYVPNHQDTPDDAAATLDAIQFVMTANPSHCTLLLKAKVQPASEPWVAYAALQFTDTTSETHITAGACIEQLPDAAPVYAFFLAPYALDTELYIPGGTPLNRHELRQAFRRMHEAHVYDQVGEYQTELLEWLGGLNRRFFDMFARALSFQPPDDIRMFVNQWLLEPRPLDVEAVKHIAEPYTNLSTYARDVEEKCNALQTIVERQADIRHLREHYAHHALLAARLQHTQTTRRTGFYEEQIARRRQQIDQASSERDTIQARLAQLHTARIEAVLRVQQDEISYRRKELERDVRQSTSEATMIHSRWLTLLHDLRREEAVLRPLLDTEQQSFQRMDEPEQTPPLTDEESQVLRSLLDSIASLSAENPPSRAFVTLIDAAIAALDAALLRAQERQQQLRQQVKEVRTRGKEVEQRREHVRKGERLYPREVERLRDLLTHMVGERPPLLCEVLEIPDERWQDAVEAMLGTQRFAILVPPRHMETAQRVLEQARLNEHIYDVGLLDVSSATNQKRVARPDSLACQVQTRSPTLRTYIDTILGDCVACETPEQARRHAQAITPRCFLYRALTMRLLPVEQYRPWYIGKRAQQSHSEACEHERQTMSQQLVQLGQQSNAINTRVSRLRRGRELALLRQRLDAPLDERPLREHIAETLARQNALATSDVEEYTREAQRLQDAIEQDEQQHARCIAAIAAWDTEIEHLERDLYTARRQQKDDEHRVTRLSSTFPDVVTGVETSLAETLAAIGHDDGFPSYTQDIQQASATASDFETRMDSELHQLTQETTAYNTRYGFTAQPGDPDEERYATELDYLLTNEVPRYEDQISHARTETITAFRDEVLLPLRERIVTAHQQLDRLNQILARLDLYGKRYRLDYQPDDSLRSYYEIIMGSNRLLTDLILENAFYLAHKPAFDTFYATLTDSSTSNEVAQKQASLVDYRSFFRYDIEMKTIQGTELSTEKAVGNVGNIETLIPFSLTIAAAFAQLYHISEHHHRATIRLVAFHDIATSMPGDVLNAVLTMFTNLGLQAVITSGMMWEVVE
jgi:hypothetical protein